MPSPFSNLYLKTLARLTETVPELHYIDQDLGQLENYGQRPPVSWPCVLLEVDEFDFSDIQNGTTQLGEGFLIVRLAYPAYSASNNLAPEAVRLKALEYYDLEQKIHEALHGWSSDGFSKLLRRKSKLERRDDDIRVRVIPYATSFTDDTTKPVRQSVARPVVSIGQ